MRHEKTYYFTTSSIVPFYVNTFVTLNLYSPKFKKNVYKFEKGKMNYHTV